MGGFEFLLPASARVASLAEYAGEPVTFVVTTPPSLPAIATVAGIFSASAIGNLLPLMTDVPLAGMAPEGAAAAGIAPNGVRKAARA